MRIEIAIFQDLAIERRHGGKKRRSRFLHQLWPDLHVLLAVVENGRRAVRPWVGETDAKRIGPVESTCMEHDVALLHAVPSAIHGPASPCASMRVENALGPSACAGGINQKSRIVCACCRIVRQGFM